MLVEDLIPDDFSALADIPGSVYLARGVDRNIFSLDAVNPSVQVSDPALVIKPFFNFDLSICTGFFIIAELQKLEGIWVVCRREFADNLNIFLLHAQIATPDQPGCAVQGFQVVFIVFYLESIFYQVSNSSAEIIPFLRAARLAGISQPNCILVASIF